MTREQLLQMALDAGGRMYSSDEVEFFLPDLERFTALVAAAALAESREHITDGSPCWCNPETTYVDPDTGVSVIVHKEPQ